MPQADELPDSLRSICRLNAATVRRDPDFHRDMDRLIAALNIDHIDSAVKPTTTGSTTSKPRPIATTLLAVFVLGVLGYGALNLFSTNRDIDSATEQQNQHIRRLEQELRFLKKNITTFTADEKSRK
jgi:cell division protein FtsB